jgi:polyribonucleotide nucleotidyltransferase
MYEALEIKKRDLALPAVNEEMLKELEEKYSTELREALNVQNKSKIESYQSIDELKKRIIESYPEEDAAKRAEAGDLFDRLKERIFRDDILNNRRRPDGRRFSRSGYLERGWLATSNSRLSLFTRGETQALVTATLGTSRTCNTWIVSRPERPSADSCSTTISHRFPWERPAVWEVRAVARSAMVRWHTAPLTQSCLVRRNGLTS